MTPPEATSAAAKLRAHFDRRSPPQVFQTGHGGEMRFVGLRKRKLSVYTVGIDGDPNSLEASELRLGLGRELRRAGHRVCNQYEDPPFALKRAFVLERARAEHAPK